MNLVFVLRLVVWSGAAFTVALVAEALATAFDFSMSPLAAGGAAILGAATACVLAWAIEDVGRLVG